MSNVVGIRPLAGANSISQKVDSANGVVAFAVVAFVCALLALVVVVSANAAKIAPISADTAILYGP